jgi:hypothetical protein
MDCNRRVEERRPWVFEHKMDTSDGHHWHHTLALVPKTFEREEEKAGTSADERLAVLEKRLYEQAARFDSERKETQQRFEEVVFKMEKLEVLLGKFLDSVKD